MKYWRKSFLFCLGGGIYATLELLWRGRTHGSMFLLGGGCFLMLGRLRRLPLPWPGRMILGTLAVTAAELATGFLVNRSFTVWDYRSLPMNYRGQICPQYALLWAPLSLLAMWLYHGVERKLP